MNAIEGSSGQSLKDVVGGVKVEPFSRSAVDVVVDVLDELVTSSTSIVFRIAGPTQRRDPGSNTVAKSKRMYVMSPTQTWLIATPCTSN